MLTTMIGVEVNKRERIKALLRSRGSSLAKISRDLRLTSSTVSAVVAGNRRSQAVEKAVAAALDTTPEELWPERKHK
jgi:lambda repressor-like predicted transcriptional regulator